MKTIHKFTLDRFSDVNEIKAYGIVQWLDCQIQDGKPTIWAIVNTDRALNTIRIYVRATDGTLNGREGSHLGTFRISGLECHAFADMEDEMS